MSMRMIATTRVVGLVIAALAGASLACTTLTQQLAPQLTVMPPVVSDPADPPSQPEAAPGADEADTVGSLQIEGGPTIASPRDARVAIESMEAVDLRFLAPENDDYSTDDLNTVPGILRYTVQLRDEALTQVSYGWCTTTEELLDENMAAMVITFAVAGQEIAPEQILVARSQQPGFDGGAPMQCESYYLVLSDYPEGETVVEVSVDFTEKVYDGMGDYGPGVQEMIYTVTR